MPLQVEIFWNNASIRQRQENKLRIISGEVSQRKEFERRSLTCASIDNNRERQSVDK